jgi:hypothetical protein
MFVAAVPLDAVRANPCAELAKVKPKGSTVRM